MFEFAKSVLVLIGNLLSSLLSSFSNGISFFSSTITTIPNFLFDIFKELPSFFQTGLSGILGLLLFVIVFKLIAIIRTS